MKQVALRVPFFINHYKKLWASCDNIYADRFDAEYCTKTAPQIERLVSKSYRSVVLSEESKNSILDLGASSIMYASLHKSHFDYITICGKMVLEGLPCPRTIAGRNLLQGMIGLSIKHFTGIDMLKWGAVPFERDTFGSRNLPSLCSRIETLLKNDKSVLVFPEMEPACNGNGNGRRTGRAYFGEIRKFASGLFGPAINVSREGKKVYIVPMAVSYDFVAEDGYFANLAKADKMKKSDNRLAALGGRLYYTLLESHFFYKMYSLGKGDIYVDIGQPIFVEPIASKTELARRAHEEASRCCRLTMPALVSHAIRNGATSRGELQRSVDRYTTMLKETKANFQRYANPQESVEGALQGLAERKIISVDDSISVRKPDIIRYYANTIAHYLS